MSHSIILGRRWLIKASGAGLAAAALPVACSSSKQESSGIVDLKGDSGAASEADSGMPATGQDSGTVTAPQDSGTVVQPQDSGGSGPEDSSTSGPTDTGTAAPDTSPPPLACTTNSNTLVVPVSQVSGGPSIMMDSRYSDPQCQGNEFYIISTGSGQYAAFSASCTHACCTIEIQGSSGHCPCHGASFDLATGAVTNGPAHNALPSIPVCTDGTNVYVQLA